MIRIVAPHFVAGVVLSRGKVSRSAPILKYMTGWTRGQVIGYCAKKHWQFELL